MGPSVFNYVWAYLGVHIIVVFRECSRRGRNTCCMTFSLCPLPLILKPFFVASHVLYLNVFFFFFPIINKFCYIISLYKVRISLITKYTIIPLFIAWFMLDNFLNHRWRTCSLEVETWGQELEGRCLQKAFHVVLSPAPDPNNTCTLLVPFWCGAAITLRL